MPQATIKKGGPLIEISEDGSNLLPHDIYAALERPLTYNHLIFRFGQAQYDTVTVTRQAFSSEPRRLFAYDSYGRMVCQKGFYPRIRALLQNLGYKVIYIDSDPPKEFAYTPDWERVLERFELRPGQEQCLVQIDMHDYGVIDAPPAFGKTHIMAMVANLYPRAKIDIVTKRKDVVGHICTLLTQTIPMVGQVGGGKRNRGRVTVYTADSLHHSDFDADILLGDECFPTGTLVDGKPIEAYQPGDLVWSVSPTGELEKQPVTRVYHSQPKFITEVVFTDGRRQVCTSGHPFRTLRGYVPAALLQPGDYVFYVTCRVRTYDEDLQCLWKNLPDGLKAALAYTGESQREGNMFEMSSGARNAAAAGAEDGDLLLPRMQQAYPVGGESEAEANLPREWWKHLLPRARTSSWNARNGACRSGYLSPGAVAVAHSGAYMGARSANRPAGTSAGSLQDSQVGYLSSGRSLPQDTAGNRDRRAVPQADSLSSEGPQEGAVLTLLQVASNSIHECGSGSRYRDLCGDGQVHNLGVARNHNYLANGLLVHNCHELMTDRLAEVVGRYWHSRNYGFSATPDTRLDNAHYRMEGLFGPTIFQMSQQQAESLDLVAPVLVQWFDVNTRVDPALPCKTLVSKKRRGIWRHQFRNQIIAEAAKAFLADGMQVLILVDTVDHALYLRMLLPEATLCYSEGALGDGSDKREVYVNRGMLESDENMTTERRLRIKQQFERREIMCAIATGVWAVGVSFNSLNVLIRADGGASETNNIQIPGRVCRIDPASGKQCGILVDMYDNWNADFRARSLERRRSYHRRGWTQVLPNGNIWQPRTRSDV